MIRKLKTLRVCRYIFYICQFLLVFYGAIEIVILCINHYSDTVTMATLNDKPFYDTFYKLVTIVFLIDYLVILFVETDGLLPSLRRLNKEIVDLEVEEEKKSKPTVENHFHDDSKYVDQSRNINLNANE